MSDKEQNENSKETEKKVSPGREILSWVFYIAFVILLTWLILHFVGQRTVVDGSSMNNTLYDGDNLIVEKLSYEFGEPNRFDIIVFRPYEDSREYYIKRIIGLPGETIQIDLAGNIYIDGEILEENFGKETIQRPGRALEPVTLGEDEYFVLGDNRNNSTDSRYEQVGNVSRDSIVGKAWARIWPLKSFGLLKNK